MIRIEITEEQVEQLRYERFAHPHPRMQRKMEALLLKSEGLPHQRIVKLLDISEYTLREYFREFIEGTSNGSKRSAGQARPAKRPSLRQFKPVTHIANRVYKSWLTWLDLDLASQRGDTPNHAPAADDNRPSPDVVHDVAARECSVRA